MKLASIDIGTNSMRLLVTDYSNEFLNREKFVNITRMGDSVDKNGYLTEEAIELNIKSLKDFTLMAKDKNVDNIFAMGTSALRDSKNKHVFLERAKNEAGIDVEVIKGEEEAKLGFMGVTSGISIDGFILMIDIGGGSTELVVGSESNGVAYSVSIDIGALRLTEKFVTNDPPSSSDIRKMREFIQLKLSKEIELIRTFEIKAAVAIGGTATTVSSVAQNMKEYDTNKVHNSKVSREQIKAILESLVGMTQNERVKVVGLQPSRADIITAGIVILDEIVDCLSLMEITISEYDNLEGLIYKKVLEKLKS